jgi:predicted nucleotidyltransferase
MNDGLNIQHINGDCPPRPCTPEYTSAWIKTMPWSRTRAMLKKSDKNGIDVLDVWIFRSHAGENFNNGSDIDIAILLSEKAMSMPPSP